MYIYIHVNCAFKKFIRFALLNSSKTKTMYCKTQEIWSCTPKDTRELLPARRVVKTPSPFKWFFHMSSFFFPIIVFPSAGFAPWSKNSHERGKGKGKGRVKEGKGKRKGKGEERERKRKKRQCLTRIIFDAKSYRFRYRFVIVRESYVCSFFSGNGCSQQKRNEWRKEFAGHWVERGLGRFSHLATLNRYFWLNSLANVHWILYRNTFQDPT